ncbi:hypothetical protein Hamer_G012134 [Homarus americanus]|uniref:Uncharacterized protein n=1 Tax=Homarus americanus TaxID=6706 RepID=A0A8J5JGG9_HOMAM|nr:hypothetical protein Hamer_G012134 [Homarus americanus]
MDGSQAIPFFSCLQSLSCYVDEQTAVLKEELKLSPGNFSNYLETVQEHLIQQTCDIDKMERFLAKFGYVPLQQPSKDPRPNIVVTTVAEGKQNVLDDQEKGTAEGPSEEVTTIGTSEGTPVLSNTGLLILQGKDVPEITATKQLLMSTSSRCGNIYETPVVRKTQSKQFHDEETTSVSDTQSYLTVEQWLTGVEENNDMTPNFVTMHKEPVRELAQQANNYTNECDQLSDGEESQPSQTPLTIRPSNSRTPEVVTSQPPSDPQIENMPKSVINKPSTPNEPYLSEYTMQILAAIPSYCKDKRGTQDATDHLTDILLQKNTCTVTPEEPSLSCSSVNPKITYTSKEVFTPEEPVLSYQQSHSSIVSASKMEDKTPEEPVLSYHPSENVDSHKENKTPEEPKRFTSYKRRPAAEQVMVRTNTPQRDLGELPCSPELSDITQSFLSLTRNSLANPQSLAPRRDLYNTKSTNEQHKTLQPVHSLRVYEKPRHHPLGKSFSDNSYVNKQFHQEVSQSGKVAWHLRGIPMEEFVGVDDVPPSPQLSDITQKIFGLMKK